MVLMSGLGFFMTGNGRTDNRVRRSDVTNFKNRPILKVSHSLILKMADS